MESIADEKKRILIIELFQETAQEYALKLRAWGYDVAVAHNHFQGLSQIEDGSYDLALVGMESQELTGCEFCRLVRSREETHDQKYTGLILLGDPSHFQELNEQCFGIDDILIRPFSSSELRWRIVKGCERRDLLAQQKDFWAGSPDANVFGRQSLSSILQKTIKTATRLQDEFSILLLSLQGLELAEIGYGSSAFSEFEKSFIACTSGLLRSTDQLGKLGKGKYCVLASHLQFPGLEGMQSRLERELLNDVFDKFACLQLELNMSGLTLSVEPDCFFSVLETSTNRLEEWLVKWSEGEAAIQGLRTAVLTADDVHLK